MWLAAAELAAQGAPGAMATVCRHRGSLPMARDAKLVVAEGGEYWGTIGGGCTEADVMAQALEAARRGSPIVVRHTLNADLAGDIGLSCGGTAEFFLEPVVAELDGLYRAVAGAITERRPALVSTALDWPAGPAKAARVGDRVVGTTPFGIPNDPGLAGVHIIVQGAAYNPGVYPGGLGAASSGGIDLGLDIN